MSTKAENERLREENAALREELKESREDAAAHLRNLETLSGKASRTDRAEQQVADRDNENVTLAKKLEAALGALGTMPGELRTLWQVVNDFLVEARTGSTAGILLGRRLESELADAGLTVGAEVDIRAQLGGLS